MWFVYVLRCSDGYFYTGCTEDVEERVVRHSSGYEVATRLRLPVVLVTYVAFGDKHKAFEFEKYLKTGSGRAFVGRYFV